MRTGCVSEESTVTGEEAVSRAGKEAVSRADKEAGEEEFHSILQAPELG